MSERSPPGRPRDPEIDRAVVDATRELLRAGGLGAVSITAVADRAGVTRPTVYRRFPDRDALALAVLQADLEVVAWDALAEVPDAAPFLDQVLGIVAPLYRYYGQDPPLTRALFQLVLFSDTAQRVAVEQQGFDFLAEIVRRADLAVRRGELRADADLAALAGSFFGLYFMIALAGAHGTLDTVDSQLALFRTVFTQHLSGVWVDPAGPGAG